MRRWAVGTFAAALVAACSGKVSGGPSGDGGADAGPDSAEDSMRASCTSQGGVCAASSVFPCPPGTRSVPADDCKARVPCCVALPPLGPGECRADVDCVGTRATEGRGDGSESMTCASGACQCKGGTVPLSNKRCGISPGPGERYLCSEGGTFVGAPSPCGPVPCDSAAQCLLTGTSAACVPPVPPRPGEEYCALVNCGPLFCGPGLTCSDPERGVCRKE